MSFGYELHGTLCNNCQVQCDDLTSKKMEFDFHSAGYLTLLEAVQAIKNVLGHLVNSIKVGEIASYGAAKCNHLMSHIIAAGE